MHVFDNHNVEDKIRNFVTKCRLQLLPCQSLLSLYYPNVHTKNCENCNFYSETVSHVLNGCIKFKDIYQKRHNRIVDLLYDKIAYANKTCEVLNVLKPCT